MSTPRDASQEVTSHANVESTQEQPVTNPRSSRSRESSRAGSDSQKSRSRDKSPFRYKADVENDLKETKAELQRQREQHDAVVERALGETAEVRQQLLERDMELQDRDEQIVEMRGDIQQMQAQLATLLAEKQPSLPAAEQPEEEKSLKPKGENSEAPSTLQERLGEIVMRSNPYPAVDHSKTPISALDPLGIGRVDATTPAQDPSGTGFLPPRRLLRTLPGPGFQPQRLLLRTLPGPGSQPQRVLLRTPPGPGLQPLQIQPRTHKLGPGQLPLQLQPT